jgi:hypothetical protein
LESEHCAPGPVADQGPYRDTRPAGGRGWPWGPPRTSLDRMMRAPGVLLVGLALSAGALGGCPRELAAPPAAGDPCEDTADCNPDGLDCGELRVCVGGRCETGRSLRVPCR